MRIGGIAGRLSIVVLLLLTAFVVLLVTPQPEQAQETQRKPDRPPAQAAAQTSTVRENSSRLPTVRLRLPPPPAVRPAPQPAKSTGTAARKTATRSSPARRTVTPLRASTPAPQARPPRQRKPPPKRRITPLAGEKTPAAAPAAQPKTAQTAADAAAVAVEPATRKAGRALLRLLEHGRGPTVEIAWPDAARDRARLHRRLRRCYGMRLAVIDGADRLFAASDPAGSPWRIDLDRFSGFLRSPAGQPVAGEDRVFARLARHHRLADWRPVRIFPRAVDAVLLSGLQHLVGAAYASAGTITAAYALSGRRLILGSIRVDGRAVAGAVELTGAADIGCRRGA